jgi:hypothetical protein
MANKPFLWFVCERLQRSSTFGKFMFVFLSFFTCRTPSGRIRFYNNESDMRQVERKTNIRPPTEHFQKRERKCYSPVGEWAGG